MPDMGRTQAGSSNMDEETKGEPFQAKQPDPITKTKPALSAVMKGVTTAGFWAVQSRSVLASCVQGEDITDAAIQQALNSLCLSDGTDAEIVYLTLLAWYILEESFDDDEDQWRLIIGKAKTWLESVGVAKPANFVRQFTLMLKDWSEKRKT